MKKELCSMLVLIATTSGACGGQNSNDSSSGFKALTLPPSNLGRCGVIGDKNNSSGLIRGRTVTLTLDDGEARRRTLQVGVDSRNNTIFTELDYSVGGPNPGMHIVQAIIGINGQVNGLSHDVGVGRGQTNPQFHPLQPSEREKIPPLIKSVRARCGSAGR